MKGNKVEVYLGGRIVGVMAETGGHRYAFAYDDGWLEQGFAVSPFSLPLQRGVFVPASPAFHGLWGVFADSLPDSWGRLLVDRMLQARKVPLEKVTMLDRLAIVGDSGMGALSYRPAWNQTGGKHGIEDLDSLAAQCHAILNHENISDLDALYRMGGSSGGARPKVITDEWIIKFPASRDMKDVGVMEKDYMDCAQACGIRVPESKLLPSNLCGGYFAVRRFDRERTGQGLVHRHMLTAAAILEADWRTAAFDYHTLMKLANILSRSSPEDREQMYRLMCFNVFAHNQDDHAKNFTWLYDAREDCWHVSPAYDLTWSATYYGERCTAVNGNGKNPGEEDLIAVGKTVGMKPTVCKRIAKEIQEIASPLEARYHLIRS